MKNEQISFIFENQKYVVSNDAYPGHCINLPHGRALQFQS